ncbi:MAG TPA: hypothetical protein VGS07_04675 [Thermoanaerobaculia bacterium]|jgi:hypothetical protein|nr:hypothetical protein [Thermoanaerobaculia bacterium]
MKKRKKDKLQIPEIISLNEELFSLEAGSLQVEELDRRLELAIAAIGNFVCDTFTCGTFSGSCTTFACGSFKIKM